MSKESLPEVTPRGQAEHSAVGTAVLLFTCLWLGGLLLFLLFVAPNVVPKEWVASFLAEAEASLISMGVDPLIIRAGAALALLYFMVFLPFDMFSKVGYNVMSPEGRAAYRARQRENAAKYNPIKRDWLIIGVVLGGSAFLYQQGVDLGAILRDLLR